MTDFFADEEPAKVVYPPISGKDYAVMREAKDKLEGILDRYASGVKPFKTSGPKQGKRKGSR